MDSKVSSLEKHLHSIEKILQDQFRIDKNVWFSQVTLF